MPHKACTIIINGHGNYNAQKSLLEPHGYNVIFMCKLNDVVHGRDYNTLLKQFIIADDPKQRIAFIGDIIETNPDHAIAAHRYKLQHSLLSPHNCRAYEHYFTDALDIKSVNLHNKQGEIRFRSFDIEKADDLENTKKSVDLAKMFKSGLGSVARAVVKALKPEENIWNKFDKSKIELDQIEAARDLEKGLSCLSQNSLVSIRIGSLDKGKQSSLSEWMLLILPKLKIAFSCKNPEAIAPAPDAAAAAGAPLSFFGKLRAGAEELAKGAKKAVKKVLTPDQEMMERTEVLGVFFDARDNREENAAAAKVLPESFCQQIPPSFKKHIKVGWTYKELNIVLDPKLLPPHIENANIIVAGCRVPDAQVQESAAAASASSSWFCKPASDLPLSSDSLNGIRDISESLSQVSTGSLLQPASNPVVIAQADKSEGSAQDVSGTMQIPDRDDACGALSPSHKSQSDSVSATDMYVSSSGTSPEVISAADEPVVSKEQGFLQTLIGEESYVAITNTAAEEPRQISGDYYDCN